MVMGAFFLSRKLTRRRQPNPVDGRGGSTEKPALDYLSDIN